MAAAAVDVGYLAASYSVPETTLHSLLSAPTVELVQSLLVQIEAKAREFEDLQSEKLRVDVELDNAVQNGEQRARTLKAAADKAHKEADDLRQKAAEQDTLRSQLAAQVETLQTSTAEYTTKINSLESRIRDLESQNRDTLATYNTKSTAYDRLTQELSDQHQKYIELRKQLVEVEEQNQTLQSAANNFKFRESNLQQEIEMLRKNNDWYDSELKTRNNDHSKFRKEKNAQIAELQRTNADAAETIESLQRTETLLRKHMEELKSKAEEDQARIQQLEDDSVTQIANFRSELDNAKRLTALQQKNAELAKNRLEELQSEYAGLQDSAATEIGQLQAELELEHSNAQQAEARAANLETLVQDLEREAAQMKVAPAPATPRRAANGALSTPGRMRSPAAFSPGGSQVKGFVSNTMILGENTTLKEEVRKLRSEDERKTTMIAEMLEELQRAEPAMAELRETNEALSARISEMSNELETALNDKDTARKDERKARGDLEGARRECEQLRQNVQDLSTQLRAIMWRQQAHEQGLEALTAEQRDFVVATENNQLPSDHLYGETATDQLISQHLVLYKNIVEAQTQNASLLRTIRQVAQQYEGDEARSKLDQLAKDHEELTKLRSKVLEDEEKIKSLTARAHSYKRERDTYREVATRRGFAPQDPEAASTFGQSFNSQLTMTPLRGGSNSQFMPQTPQAGQIPGVDKLVRDLQSQVDILKEESAADRTALKSQVDGLAKDNQQLQAEKVHLDSQLRREQDRCARLETSAKLHESEKTTLQERYHNIQATLAKQDDKVVKAEQEVADALVRVKGLESELTTLKASQSMWKTIEARLTERNQELMDERDRLTKIISNMQNMQNQHELTSTEKRRELQDKVNALEAELQIARRKLEEEVTEHRKAILQRDYERTESQRRIDDLIKAKNDAEIRSASADTARQQLEQRVSELQALLQTAEERAQSLRPRPTPRANAEAGEQEEDRTREDELAEQLAELQQTINRKQEELDAAKEQIEGYRNIAQEAENALQESVEASTLYEEEMSRVQEEKDATIADLQRRVEEISSELVKTGSELTEVRGQHEQETLRLTQEKETLDAEITRLREDVADYKAEAERQTEYVKSQADIAIRAHQDYEQELAKHGETMKNLRTLRDEYTSIKSEVANFKADAEVARTALEQNEENWKSMQERYESQVIEAKRIQDDLRATNKTLLKQFDDYKAQIDNLKSSRTEAAYEASASAPGSSNNLEDLIAYLRREKEIKEVEYNIKEQEAKRLEAQLSLVQSQLDQAREKLYIAQANAQNASSGTNLQALQNQVEQLNVFRESNMTLRSEAARLETKVDEKTKEIQQLQEELEPLRSRVFVLEGELELSQGYQKQAETARDYWQERYNKFLTGSDRVAPEEVDKLKQENIDLQQERDQAVERANSLEENVKTLEANQTAAIDAAKEAQKEELKQKFNKRHKQLMEGAMQPKDAEIENLTTERDQLQSTLASVRQELADLQVRTEQSQQQTSSTEQEVVQYRSQLEALQQELQAAQAARDEALTQVNTSSNANADVTMSEEGQVGDGDAQAVQDQIDSLRKALDDTKKQLAEAQNRAYSAENDYSALQVKASLLTDRIAKLEKDDAEKSSRIVELQEQVAANQQQPSQPSPAVAPSANEAAAAELEKVKQELIDVQKALDEAKAKAEQAVSANTAATNPPSTEEEPANLVSDLQERETKLKELEASLEQRETKVSRREAQANGLRDLANNKVRDMREKCNAELATLQTEIDTLKKEKEATSTKQGAQPVANATQAEAPPTSGVPAVDADDKEIRDFFAQNKTIQAILRSNINSRTNALTEQIKALKSENVTLKTQKPEETTVKHEDQPQSSSQQDIDAALSKAKAEHEQHLKKALEKAEQMHAMKAKMKEGMLVTFKARSNYVEKAAKETPTEEVAKVWPGAVEAGNKAKEQHAAEEKRKAAEAAQKQAVAQSTGGPGGQSAGQPQQQSGSTNNAPQTNGAKDGTPAQVPKPAPTQQVNPFIPTGNVVPNTLPGASGTSQLGRGISGITQPVQSQNALQQPTATQQQQGGRGRGDGVGTGPGALRGIIGNQTQIPRGGGSGIPLPGGRGRGQQGQQGQQQPSAIAIPNAQGAGASQIGRGGRGGRGGGRGGNQGNPASPRGSLNPGAAQFTPGAGRGQKRGAEDDGEGGTRGGKRARGGRGQGGAAAGGE